MITRTFYRHSICMIGALCCFIPFHLSADELCDQALNEGKQKYNAGQYQQAKELFNFVREECGASYGAANSWINKCNEALIPKLSVSRTSISVVATAAVETITVTSNRSWELRNTNSSMFSVYRNGSTVSVSCLANTGDSRSDYFDIVTLDGSKSVRIKVNQAGANYLTVNGSTGPVNMTLGWAASSVTFNVDCSGTYTLWRVPSFCSVRNRTSTSFTLDYTANNGNQSRTDYMKVQYNGKEVRINFTQEVSPTTPTAKVEEVWVDHNVYENNKKGMRIHVKFNVINCLGKKGQVAVYFFKENGDKLKDTNSSYRSTDGQVAYHEDYTPSYNNSTYSDFTLFMPYSELHLNRQSGSYKFYIVIWGANSVVLARSDWTNFTMTY